MKDGWKKFWQLSVRELYEEVSYRMIEDSVRKLKTVRSCYVVRKNNYRFNSWVEVEFSITGSVLAFYFQVIQGFRFERIGNGLQKMKLCCLLEV